ncbi:hypothetical protein GO986_20255 [Deinococcus sp. HMF7620]|uniref:Uncharacterized protein n=1 Tax=Deinococcus arboris TaxID=2682977 RepID=A0A7C9LPS9_9DEIO|nr:hypothetical protein [Deinococcus arboris]
MEEILVPLFFFGSVFGFPLLRRHLIHRHAMDRAALALRQPVTATLPNPPVQADDAPALALRLPEPHRLYTLALLCRLEDAPQDTEPATHFLLRQTRAEYLPDTLRAYLAVTPAARQQLGGQGHTPESLLGEQLALLNQAVTEALAHDHTAANRLLTQGRFLADRARAPVELTALERFSGNRV